MSAAEAGTEIVGFAQIEQSFSAMADGVDAGLAGELLKVALDRGALFKWNGDETIEDIASFLLNISHGWRRKRYPAIACAVRTSLI